MRTEFLKNLGITEQSVIDQIMAENGRDVDKVRTELTAAKQQVTDLQGQITTKDTEIATLNSKVGEVETLRSENNQLKTDNTNLSNELNTKITQIQKTHAIENYAREQKAKNVKAVMAMLDMTKITFENDQLNGHVEQFDALKTGEDTSFLFGEVKSAPSGMTPSYPNTNPTTSAPTGKTFAEAVASAFGAPKN